MTGAPWYSAYIIGFLVASVLWMFFYWRRLDDIAALGRELEAYMVIIRELRSTRHRQQLARDARCACRQSGGGCDAA